MTDHDLDDLRRLLEDLRYEVAQLAQEIDQLRRRHQTHLRQDHDA